MKKYDLTKPNRAKKAARMQKKEDAGSNHFWRVLRKGRDGKPDYTHVVPKRVAMKIYHKDFKSSREYKVLGEV